MKLELRAITKRLENRDKAVMISSTIPSAVLLLGIATHVLEGQNCDRGLIGECQLFRARTRRHGLRLLLLANVTNKAHPLAGYGADKSLRLPRVVDCGPGCIDTSAQCRFRYNPAVPNRRYQIVLAKEALAVSDQGFKQIKRLRSDWDHDHPTTQLASVAIERKIFEQIQQLAVPAKA